MWLTITFIQFYLEMNLGVHGVVLIRDVTESITGIAIILIGKYLEKINGNKNGSLVQRIECLTTDQMMGVRIL